MIRDRYGLQRQLIKFVQESILAYVLKSNIGINLQEVGKVGKQLKVVICLSL